jgi:hypothetical protein
MERLAEDTPTATFDAEHLTSPGITSFRCQAGNLANASDVSPSVARKGRFFHTKNTSFLCRKWAAMESRSLRTFLQAAAAEAVPLRIQELAGEVLGEVLPGNGRRPNIDPCNGVVAS